MISHNQQVKLAVNCCPEGLSAEWQTRLLKVANKSKNDGAKQLDVLEPIVKQWIALYDKMIPDSWDYNTAEYSLFEGSLQACVIIQACFGDMLKVGAKPGTSRRSFVNTYINQGKQKYKLPIHSHLQQLIDIVCTASDKAELLAGSLKATPKPKKDHGGLLTAFSQLQDKHAESADPLKRPAAALAITDAGGDDADDEAASKKAKGNGSKSVVAPKVKAAAKVPKAKANPKGAKAMKCGS